MLIRSFLNYIQFEKRYSAHTMKSYENDLTGFKDFLSESYDKHPIEAVDQQQIRSYVIYLMNKGIKASSIKRKVSTLNSFYKYLLKTSKIKKSPMTGILTPKKESRLPSFISEKEASSLLASLPADNFENSRNSLILRMLYSTGIRRAELIGLKLDSVNRTKCEIKVLGKRNKERIVPFHRSLLDNIDEYLNYRAEELGEAKQEFLFIRKNGKKLYPKLVYNIVHDAIASVSTLEKKSPHLLRHTFATHLLNEGADINAIKELLGHSNLASTQVYTHNSIEKLKDVHKLAHPKS